MTGVGAYEDICFNATNVATELAPNSKVWLTDADDDSDEESEELDEVEANEKILDSDVESIDEAAHISSKNFEQSVVLVEAPVIVETSVVVESQKKELLEAAKVDYAAPIPRIPLDAI